MRSQFQTTECGIAALRTLFAYFDHDVTAHELRVATGVGRDCLHAGDLRRAAEAFGYACTVRSVGPEQLRELHLPVIVHLRFIHFAVLESVGTRHVRLNCPIAGRIEMSDKEFERDFTGIVLSVKPAAGAASAKRPVRLCSQERRWWSAQLRSAVPAVIAGTVLAIVRSALVIGIAWLMAHGRASVAPLLAFGGGIGAASFASTWVLQRYATWQSMAGLERLLTSLQNVSSHFYVYRQITPLLWLPKELHAVYAYLADRVLPALFGCVELALLVIGAMWLSGPRGLMFLAVCAAWSAALIVLTHWRRATERAFAGEERSAVAMAAAALLHPEKARFGRGAEEVSLALHGAAAHTTAARTQSGTPAWLLAQMPLVLAVVGMFAAMTIAHGPINAFLFIALATAWAARPLTHLRGAVDFVRALAQPVLDVLHEPAAVKACPIAPVVPSGDVVLRANHLRFSYTTRPLLRDITLSLHARERVALTGSPGCGKTALTELLAGIHTPQCGCLEIPSGTGVLKVGGRPALLEASLAENITLWDKNVTEAALLRAVHDAQLADVIAELPGGLNFRVEADGRNLSGGQRQRIEFARALVLAPQVLLLDDALSALDQPPALALLDALRARGCTVLLATSYVSDTSLFDRVLHLYDGALHEQAQEAHADRGFSAKEERAVPFLTQTIEMEAPEAGSVTPEEYAALAFATGFVTHETSTKPWKEGLSRTSAIQHLMGNDYLVRPVRFHTDTWWQQDFGEALVFRQDGMPLIARHDGTRATLMDPRSHASVRLDPHVAKQLSPNAFQFPTRPNSTPANATPWRRKLYAAMMPEYALIVLAASLFATGVILAGLSVFRGRPLMALLISGLGAGCSMVAMSSLTQRAAALAGRRHVAAITSFLVQVEPGTIRAWATSRLVVALEGIAALQDEVLTTLQALPLRLALLLVSACVVVMAQGVPANGRFLLCLLTCALCPVLGARIRASHMRSAREASQATTEYLYRVLSAAKSLRAFHRFGPLLERWRTEDKRQQQLGLRYDLIVAAAKSTGIAVLFAAVPAGLRLEKPLAGVFFCISMFLALDLGEVLERTIELRVNSMAANDLLATPRKIGVSTAAHNGTLRADAVSFRYPHARRATLACTSLTVPQGELTLLQGPSGSGKSTLLRVLMGLHAPSAGRVLWNDAPLTDLDLQRWRTHITFLSQEDALEDAATVRTHLGGQATTPARLWQALEAVELASAVRAMPMGLQTIVSGETLSTGEVQRLRLAAAFLDDTSILVADEATSAVPEAMEARIFARLRERGVTCLVATHRNGLRDHADSVYSTAAFGMREAPAARPHIDDMEGVCLS